MTQPQVSFTLIVMVKIHEIQTPEKYDVPHNDPKFSNRQAWANNADPDQTAPKEQSDQSLHCLQFPLHLLDALL